VCQVVQASRAAVIAVDARRVPSGDDPADPRRPPARRGLDREDRRGRFAPGDVS
jgi:hypothetical protein